MTVLNLDVLHGLAMLPDNSVDAALTDGPYEIGMMGKAWDKTGIAFSVAMWRESMRVLKPGGHLLSFSGTRTYHRMACAIEDAGYDVRDMIEWVYAQGMPKGANLLKPAHEPICVARKPFVTNQVGGLFTERCKIPVDADGVDASQMRTMNVSQHDGADGWGMNTTGPREGARVLDESGRWPANLIHDGSPEVQALFPDQAARFFQCCPYEQSDIDAAALYYVAKASKREKGVDNKHPTVKPVSLGRYLARLICPPGGTLLDQFAGSGSLLIGAALEGFNVIGFDNDPVSAELANRRLLAARGL